MSALARYFWMPLLVFVGVMNPHAVDQIGLDCAAVSSNGLLWPRPASDSSEGHEAVPEEGDAICELRAKHQGGLRSPTWLNEDAECGGSCPSEGDCKLEDTGTGSSSGGTIVTIVECRCPVGGGGNGGCRAQQVRTSTDGGATTSSRKLKCVGSDKCVGRTTCALKTVTGSSTGNFSWASCKCQ